MLLDLTLAFVSSACASLFFNISRRNIAWSARVGAAGWGVYQIVLGLSQPVTGVTFIASLVIGLLGESLAIIRKKPATTFILPGIIPLVPGAGMYFTMVALQARDVFLAATRGIQTIFIALAIACGLVISLTLLRLVRRYQQKKPASVPHIARDLIERPEHRDSSSNE